MISGKRLLLDVLRRHGVTHIFGNPGTTEIPLIDALSVEEDIRYVLGLQESIVLAMADGYAQSSGRLAVASLHAAPGLGNAMGALHNASKAGAPVIVTAGQQDLSYNFTEPNLWGELTRIAQPLVKWAYEIHKASDLARVLHRAAKVALSPPTGPVFLSLPADILEDDCDEFVGAPTQIGAGFRADLSAIRRAANLIARSKRPVIVAGDAVAQSAANAELVALAELIGAPVYLEGIPNRNVFPPAHGLFRGPLQRLARTIRAAMEDYDLVVSIGGDLFTLALPGDVDPMPPSTQIVHLDVSPWEIGKNYPTTGALWGDPKATLPELHAAVDDALTADERAAARRRCTEEIETGRAQLEKLTAQAIELSDRTPLAPLALTHAIASLVTDDVVIANEGITSGQGLQRFLTSADPRGYFSGRGGGIGWAMPASVGIQLAQPDRPVLALIGDGSAMYSIQGLYSAAREALPIVYVIANNASYRIIKQRVHASNGHAAQTANYVGVDMEKPRIDFVGMAASYGLTAERATTVEDFREALQAALTRRSPSLIEVEVEAGL